MPANNKLDRGDYIEPGLHDSPTKCACCGCGHGQFLAGEVRTLGPVRIMSKRRIPRGAPDGYGSILMCQECRGRMSFDLTGFYNEVDLQSVNENVFDTTLYYFLSEFVSEVWGDVKAPTYQQLATVLNAAHLYTYSGAPWTYHNLRQKVTFIGLDLKSLHKPKVLTEVPDGVEDMVAAAAAILPGHPEFGPSFINPSWANVPEGMPGT